MAQMTKEDLKEYRHISDELRRLDGERLKWRARAERSTVAPSMAPVLGGQHDPMPMIMDRLTGIQRHADRCIAQLADAKMRIERAIEKLPSLQRQVMRAVYRREKLAGDRGGDVVFRAEIV
jgi:DNA-directed RNA polymerase specialized sigma24 family protein